MEANNICCSCAGELENIDAISCNGFCKSSFHLKCVNQTSATRDLINKSSQLFWMCKGCTKMMSVANFRQTMASTNTVLQLVNEEHNKVLQELRSEIELNTAKINSILQQNSTTDTQTYAPNITTNTTRKRRRLQEEDDNSNNDASTVNRFEGTKQISADVPIPLAAAQREKKFLLYLSGFAPDASVQEIADLVKNNLSTDEAVDVTKLVPKGKNLCELTFVSFKVGIGIHLRDLALQTSTWQKGIVFRQFDSGQSTRNNFRTNTVPYRDSAL